MRLALDHDDDVALFCKDQELTKVDFPPKTEVYRQTSSCGVPFRGMAVLQGRDVLSFPYLWPCDLAKAGLACRFCHCGSFTQQRALQGLSEGRFPSPSAPLAAAPDRMRNGISTGPSRHRTRRASRSSSAISTRASTAGPMKIRCRCRLPSSKTKRSATT
jgi:hypothetical protein